MFYYHIVFDDLTKPEVQRVMFDLAGFPNGTIFDQGQHVRSPNLPKNEWIMSFHNDMTEHIADFQHEVILSITQVNSDFVFKAQQIQY